jgi:perosamine synthetase
MAKKVIKLIYPTIGKDEINSIYKIMRSNYLERGCVSFRLEKKLEDYFKAKYTILTSNATAALFVSLIASGISKDDEIITTPLSFIVTANVILLCGAKPIFVDIDENTFNIDVSQIEKKITHKTKAIISVNLYGQPCNYRELKRIRDKHKLILISDSYQAIGARYLNETINKYADVTVFSFFNSKNIISGEGGLIVTDNQTIKKKVELLINHGQIRGRKYECICVGWNFRSTDLQAAIIETQLKRLEKINKKRRKNAEYYMSNFNLIKGIITPKVDPNAYHVYNRFTIRIVKDFPLSRSILIRKLYREGIETEIAYPKPLYFYSHLKKYRKGRFPIVEKVTKQILSLPVHQNLTKKDLDYCY